MHWIPVLNHFDSFLETCISGREDLKLKDQTESNEKEKAEKEKQSSVNIPFPTATTLWILKTSTVLLENCANKHVYNSSAYFGDLLPYDDDQVALDALRLLATATRRAPGSRGNKFKAPARLRSRLLALCADVSDLATDTSARGGAGGAGDASDSEQSENVRIFGVPVVGERNSKPTLRPRGKPPRGGGHVSVSRSASNQSANTRNGKIHFVFYCPGGSDVLLGDLGLAGRRVVVEQISTGSEGVADGSQKRLETDRAVTARLAKEHGVPIALRFSLFSRVRLARLESSADPNEAFKATLFRLLSFVVLLQSDRSSEVPRVTGDDNTTDSETGEDLESSDSAVGAFLTTERPELVAELFRALRYERLGLPNEVIEASLRTLAALAGDRAHATATLSAMRGGGHPAILTSLVNSTVLSLTNAPSPPIGDSLTKANLPRLELDAIHKEADVPVPNADALVALLSTLVTTHGGCLFLRDVSVLPSLTPLLRNRNPRHVHVVSHAVHVLEIFMDYASQAAAAFRDLGGMKILVERLKHEAQDALAEHAATYGINSEETKCSMEGSDARDASAATTAMDESTTPKTSTAHSHASTATPTTPPTPTYLVSSTRRVLLKALMRALALTNFSPGTANVKVAGLEDGTLSVALTLIFRNPKLFGAGVFSLAANLLCDVMNHEPTCYPELEAQNVPQVFLQAWEGEDPGPSPSADALCCLPNALGALCLSPLGLARVQQSSALNALITAFTTRTYARAMFGETATAIGGNIDELLRHVPDLQPTGVSFAISVLRRLLTVGGVELGKVDGKEEKKPDGSPEDSVPSTSVAMETDGAAGPSAVTAVTGTTATTATATTTAPSATPTATTPTTSETMKPSVVFAPLDLTPLLATPVTNPPVSPSFLAEAVANVSRLIDSMLPTEECAKMFVDNGGVALLLRLHAMPGLSHTFSSSSACHALSVTLRSFAGRSPYSHVLTGETQRALTECVRVANGKVVDAIRAVAASGAETSGSLLWNPSLAIAEAVNASNDGAEVLPSGVVKGQIAHRLRDTTTLLATTMSFLNLTTSLLRSSPGTMPGLLNAKELTENAQPENGAKEWTTGGVLDNLVYTHRNVEILAAILAEGDEERLDEAMKVDQALNAPTEKGSTLEKQKRNLKATLDTIASCKTELAHFRTSFNYFCSSLVKNVANARHRASPETMAFLRMPIGELSVYLSQTVTEVVDALERAERESSGEVVVIAFRGSEDKIFLPRVGIARRRLCELFPVLHAILIDERRRCSQGLVLNYMSQSLGMDKLTEGLRGLWRVAESEAGKFEKIEKVPENKKAKQPVGTLPVASVNGSSVPGTSELMSGTVSGASLPPYVTSSLRSATSLLLQLVDVEVLFGSSGSAANVVAQRGFVLVPDLKSSYNPPTDPRTFAARLHVTLAPAVLEAWRSNTLAHFPPDAAAHLMSTLVHLGKGVTKLPERVEHYLERERGAVDRDLNRTGFGNPRAGRGHPGAVDGGPGVAGFPHGDPVAARRWVADNIRRVEQERPARPPPPPFTPSPTMVSSICEMGFSDAQARAALIAVRGRSIEIAMDWLFSHPDEASRADEEAAATAATPATSTTPATATPATDGTALDGGAFFEETTAAARRDGLSTEAVEANMVALGQVDAAARTATAAVTDPSTPTPMTTGEPAAPGTTTTPADNSENPDAERMRALEMSVAEEKEDEEEDPPLEDPRDRRPVGWVPVPAAPAKKQKPSPETQKVEEVKIPPVALPSPCDLLQPILVLSRANPSMAFSGANLLSRELKRASDDQRAVAVQQMVNAIADPTRVAGESGNPMSEGVDAGALDAAAQLFVLVLVSEPTTRKDASNADAPNMLLAMLEKFLDVREHLVKTNANSPGDAAVCPQWATASFLALHKLCEWRLPDEGEISDSKKESNSNKNNFFAVLGNPDGYLNVHQRERACDGCVRLLALAGGGHEKDETEIATIASARTSDAEVGGVQAAMQLLVHLSKDHTLAVRAHDNGAITNVLDLPLHFAFQAYDALASSVLRHVAEDPHALQLAMESELHAVLSVTGNTPGVTKTISVNGSIAAVAKHVLTHMMPVLQRSPSAFIAALTKCAFIDNSQGRTLFSLKNQKANDDIIAEIKKENEKVADADMSKKSDQPSGSGSKAADISGRVASSKQERYVFGSVIQSLVEAVKAYPPIELPKTGTGNEIEIGNVPSAMETDANVVTVDSEGDKNSTETKRDKGPSAPSIAAVRASLALRLLTDFTLVYSAAAGQILKRDKDDKDGNKSEGLLTHVLYSQLAGESPNTSAAGMPTGDTGWDGGERAAYFLLAMCVRSPEARRRVLTEVAKALTKEQSASEISKSEKSPKSPFAPARAFVEFVNSLVKTAGSKAHLANELQKGMKDTRLLSALTTALDRVDLDDNDAADLVRAMLRPMETLTKPGNLFQKEKEKENAKGPSGVASDATNTGAGAAGGSGAQAATPARASNRRRSAGGAAVETRPDPVPSTSPNTVGANSSLTRMTSLEHREDDPATMARMGDEASRMFDTLMGGDDEDACGGSDEEHDDESESGEEGDESGSDEGDEDDESGSDSEDPSGIDPMDDDEEHEEAAMGVDDDDHDHDEAIEYADAHRRDRLRHGDDRHEDEQFEDDDDADDTEGDPDAEDDVPEDEEAADDEIGDGDDDVLHMEDEDDDEDEIDEEEWEEADGLNGDDPLGFTHDEFMADDDGGELDDDGGLANDDDADDVHAERRAADQLAGRLQGIIAEAQRRGGEEPVVELRVRDMRLRELVHQHGGGAILNSTRDPFGGGVRRVLGPGAGRASGGDVGRDLGQGGILSDIFALRRSLDDARRDARVPQGDPGGRRRRDSGNRASAFESNVVWGGASDRAFAGPAMHPMLLRPSGDSEVAGDAATSDIGPSRVGASVSATGPGGASASLQSVLASISGEMSRLAVAPGGDPRAVGGSARGNGAHQIRTDSGFVVLPEVESLGSLLRIERADGRNGRNGHGDAGQRRGLSVADARTATWSDISALGPNEETPQARGHSQALEDLLLTTLEPLPKNTSSERSYKPGDPSHPILNPTSTNPPGVPSKDVVMGTDEPIQTAPSSATEPSPMTAQTDAVPPVEVVAPGPTETAAPNIEQPPVAETVPEVAPSPVPETPTPEPEVDSEFLNALPESLRTELVNTNRAIARLNQQVVNDGNPSVNAPRDDEIMNAVDPEFLAALPPDMQAAGGATASEGQGGKGRPPIRRN